MTTPLPEPMFGGFVPWLRECFNRGGLHGSDLLDHNIQVAAGRLATFPADADDDLRKAEALGWITRGRLSPTLSQRAFLGLAYRKTIPDCHASCWYWEPVKYNNLKYAEASIWLKAREAKIGIHRCAKASCSVLVREAGETCTRTDIHHK